MSTLTTPPHRRLQTRAGLRVWFVAASLASAWAWAQAAQPVAPVASQPHAPTSILREGAFIVDRLGRVLRHDTGAWIVVFEADDASPLPTMILEPSLNLMALQRLAEGPSGSPAFRLNGEVFTYRGRNHLLVTRYETVAPSAAAAEDKAAGRIASAEPPELPRPSEPATEPSVAELIQALERATPKREGDAPAAMQAPQRVAGDSDTDETRLLREGAMLFSRTGRVVRDAAGASVFIVDADADSAASAEPPLRLAPSLATMALEAAAEASGGALPVVISGRALLYEGRNYLLPTVFRIRQPAQRDITTAQ